MIPLVHDFAGETVLVVGGGAVATRKARRFAAEASVIVVSPTFTDRLRSADGRATEDGRDAETTTETDGGRIELVRQRLEPDDVAALIDRAEPALVVAATDDPAINAATEAAARDRGVLINRTDVSGGRDPGSVVVPATVEDGPVTFAITTGATSPAVSRYLRERIEAEFDGVGDLARLVGDVRTDLIDRDVDPETRREAVRSVVRSPAVQKGLQTGETNPRQLADGIVERVRDHADDPGDTSEGQ
ncbi:bifunctional precorrin-2 dehydrogenase/sirohydrochlorin ferrochelatase [Halopenitus sp. POP-27]|uniref:precorrin-2 dehydrogenase/sirohydrochlorin ferrochelatase family protein n=1 Tax=Halopenitus sp. POP-27 TaxID=2994425 RepID=UPI00246903A8|nr:bifunctional precorrin-2 dehydrogenase/sirohydrochlorin ferrochelatase [Halopenitus sp. POP-27]